LTQSFTDLKNGCPAADQRLAFSVSSSRHFYAKQVTFRCVGRLRNTESYGETMIGRLFVILLLVQEPLPELGVFREDLWRIFQAWSQTGALMDGSGATIEGGALKNYTYTQKTTSIKLDDGGKARETETSLYHVVQGLEPWQYYRKLVAKNGVPLSTAELEKQDREQKKREQKLRKEMEEAAREAEKKKAAQSAKAPVPAGKQEENFIDFVTRVYDIQIVRREVIDGYSTVMIAFKKKPGLKPKSVDEKFMQHLAIRAWMTEQDHQPMRVEVELLEPASFGYGVLGKIRPGSGGVQERRKINDEVWAPVRVDGTFAGRLLFVKRNQRLISEFSDFKKYSVETFINVVPPDR
jgi:hypothetical protein